MGMECTNTYQISTTHELVISLQETSFVIAFQQRRATGLRILDEKGQEITMAVTIGPNKKRTFTVVTLPNPGMPLDGIPVWTVTPTGGVQLFPSADGMTCDVVWASALSSQMVTVTADATLGSGTRNISDSEEVTTTDIEAAGLNITVGDEVPNA